MLEKVVYNYLKDIKWIDEDDKGNIIYLPIFNKLLAKFIDVFSRKIEKSSFERVFLKGAFEFGYDEYSYYYLAESEFNLVYKNNNEELSKHKTLDILALFERFIQEYAALPTISGKHIIDYKKSFGVFTSIDEKYIDLGNVEYFDSKVKGTLDFSLINVILKGHMDERGLVLPPRLSPYQVCFLMDSNAFAKDIKLVSSWDSKMQEMNISSYIDDSPLSMKEKIEKREKEGIPLLIEVYHKNIEKDKYTLLIRYNKEKRKISYEDFSLLPCILDDIQKQMYQSKLKKHLNSLDSLISCCMNDTCISKLKEEGFDLIIPFMQPKNIGNCKICNQENKKSLYKLKKI